MHILILFCYLALLPITFNLIAVLADLTNYQWPATLLAIILIIAAFWRLKIKRTLTLMQNINVILLALIATLLCYQLSRVLWQEQAIMLTLTEQTLLLITTLCLWLLHHLSKQYINQNTQQTKSTYQLLTQSLLQPTVLLSLVSALALTTISLLALKTLIISGDGTGIGQSIAIKMLERGIIPPLTLWLFYWGLLLLVGKFTSLIQYRLNQTQSALNVAINRQKNANTADFWRLVNSTAKQFYDIPRYINYAIPILGFIGTVLGISLSAQGIATMIDSPQGLTASNQDLNLVITPLGIAFDTTLVALSLGLLLTLIQVSVNRFEKSLFNKLRQQHNQANGLLE